MSQEKLNPKINKNNSISENAKHFRALAIDHLRNGNGIVAQGFRDEYEAINDEPFENFLKKQENNGAWASYVELEALMERLGVEVVITSKDHGNEATWFLNSSINKDKNVPIFHIYCDENRHFIYQGFEEDGKYYKSTYNGTDGDGNCMYNAVAQGAASYLQFQEDPNSLEPEDKIPSLKVSTKDFTLESQCEEYKNYNENYNNSDTDVIIDNPYEEMDRSLAIMLGLQEEDRISFFRRSQKVDSSSNEVKKVEDNFPYIK